MKCSGTTANLLSTRLCEGGRDATRSSGGMFSNGSKTRFLPDGDGTGLVGLLASAGEKRSWNYDRAGG